MIGVLDGNNFYFCWIEDKNGMQTTLLCKNKGHKTNGDHTYERRT